uniref:Heat shock protein 903 n=1 Tax=Dugesia japonica TaxID=6161 RepID=A0A2R4NBU1_DUGJA|nr:heat shock protein 903 [Dugesia japonica]
MSRYKSGLSVILFSILILGVINLSQSESHVKSETDDVKVNEDILKSKQGSKTDDEVVKREEEAINIDGLNVAQMKELREKAEKFAFQAEVDRMMKLIINSLYKNKEIFLRELISNASDALDKIRFISLTDSTALDAAKDLLIKIKADKDGKSLHIIDTGVGMTKQDLITNLGTIAKSGTSDFLKKLSDSKSTVEMGDLIGQFGVGFYSTFLVADKVTVISKHNDDKQHIWESDANSFSVVEDPRGNTLQRGTEIILHLKEEAHEYLEPEALKNLVTKYSQFINFPIYLWASKTETVDEPADKPVEPEKTTEKKDDDVTVEEEKEKDKPKKVEKTVWDWELVNKNKPIWTRKTSDIKDEEYNEFYKSFGKTSENPLAKIHFTAEGEVTFKSILFVPAKPPYNYYQNPESHKDNIKMYVRRVFITDDFHDMMPKYLSFIVGIVDSDDLPLNVSRETLQQNKLLKVIKKKLVRKTLDMLKKMSEEDFDKFWKEFSTSLKLGVVEDVSNRTRLAKLLRFWTSHSDKKQSSLTDYVSRMKEKQDVIYYVAGQSKEELIKSPLVEKVLKKGFEVVYMVDPVDEYVAQSVTEFEGKKLQNLGKEGVKFDQSDKAKEQREIISKEFEPLLKWFKDIALTEQIEKAEISERLHSSPCAVVASTYGWTGNMERIMKAQAYQSSSSNYNEYQSSQKKILEINPRHPLIKELKRQVEKNPSDEQAKDIALTLYDTAVLRSGYSLQASGGFADRIEKILRTSLNIPHDEAVEDDEPIEEKPVEDEGEVTEPPKNAEKPVENKETVDKEEL